MERKERRCEEERRVSGQLTRDGQEIVVVVVDSGFRCC